MKTLNINVKFKVPRGGKCNQCRFCVKHKKQYICVLHNMPLLTDGITVNKADDCVHQMLNKRDNEVHDKEPEVIKVDPNKLMDNVIASYRKAYVKYSKEGYPDSIVHTLAAAEAKL